MEGHKSSTLLLPGMSKSVHSIAKKEGLGTGVEGDFPLDDAVVQGKSLERL